MGARPAAGMRRASGGGAHRSSRRSFFFFFFKKKKKKKKKKKYNGPACSASISHGHPRERAKRKSAERPPVPWCEGALRARQRRRSSTQWAVVSSIDSLLLGRGGLAPPQRCLSPNNTLAAFWRADPMRVASSGRDVRFIARPRPVPLRTAFPRYGSCLGSVTAQVPYTLQRL